MTAVDINYERVGQPNEAYVFEPNVNGNLTLNILPGGGPATAYPTYEFAHVAPTPPPPPPPPVGFFLPDPAGYTKVLEHDFTKLSALPTDEWKYGGRPGGTNNCEWVSSAVTMDAEGVLLTMRFNASDTSAGVGGAWEGGAIGTTEAYKPPFRIRVYERDHDANINGKNSIDLSWTNPWYYELDRRENSISNGAWVDSITRIHNGSGANVIPPIYEKYTPDFLSHCYEWELTPSGNSGYLNIYYDGVRTGQQLLNPSDWTAICS